MKVTHGIATVIVGVGITASGVLLSQAWGGASEPQTSNVPALQAPAPMGAIVAQAADRAALVQMCLDGLHDADTAARFTAAVAAHPALAVGIDANCDYVPLAP
jgi:hypothetical protein